LNLAYPYANMVFFSAVGTVLAVLVAWLSA